MTARYYNDGVEAAALYVQNMAKECRDRILVSGSRLGFQQKAELAWQASVMDLQVKKIRELKEAP